MLVYSQAINYIRAWHCQGVAFLSPLAKFPYIEKVKLGKTESKFELDLNFVKWDKLFNYHPCISHAYL